MSDGAPQHDLSLLLAEAAPAVTASLVQHALGTTDVVLVSRDHEDDVARYGIDVHEIVLRRHEFFVSALDGGYSEGATFVDAQASTRKRKLPDTFNSSSSSAPDAGESPEEEVDASSQGAFPAGAQSKVARKKLIKLGLPNATLLMITAWLYTEKPPALDNTATLEEIIELYAASQMLHLPRLEEQIIERLKERKFKMHGRQLFKVLRSEALARHPRLRDVIFRRFTFRLLNRAVYPSKLDDITELLQSELSASPTDSQYRIVMRGRLCRFLILCPWFMWSSEGSGQPNIYREAARSWWTDGSAELLKNMPDKTFHIPKTSWAFEE